MTIMSHSLTYTFRFVFAINFEILTLFFRICLLDTYIGVIYK